MKNNHFHNHDGVYELSPITNRLLVLLVKPVTKRSLHVYLSRRTRSFRSFYCFTKHSFRQFWPLAGFKDYFSCFRGLEKAGFSEKTSCGSKCLFADHRASRTSRTHDSSERRQHFISVPLTIDKYPGCQRLFFFFLRAKRSNNAAKPRQRGAKRREKK